MKKTLLLLLTILLPMVASAYDACVDGIYYDLEYDYGLGYIRATVTHHESLKYSGEVVIPSSITYAGITYSVDFIGDQAFYNCENLTSVTIPNTVWIIGYQAFCGCTGLTSITIPNRVKVINGAAFCNCTSLTSIIIPSKVEEIETHTFSGCHSLKSVILRKGVKKIQSLSRT